MPIVVSIRSPSSMDRRFVASKLVLDGWLEGAAGNDLAAFCHPKVATEFAARGRLRAAGLEPDNFHVENVPEGHWTAWR